MKKTPFIILTLVASLSMSLSFAGDNSPALYPPELLTESGFEEGDTTKNDTTRIDSTNNYYQPQVTYNYYYYSRFWNSLFRIFRPTVYYATINQPGYVPRRIRTAHQHTASRRGIRSGGDPVTGRRPMRSSSRRGGFGDTGSAHTQTN